MLPAIRGVRLGGACVLLSSVITKRWLALLILVVCKTLLGVCLRAIWFEAASHEFELRAAPLSSSANRLADLLSRWHVHSSFKTHFLAAPGTVNLQEIVVHPSIFSLSDDI